MTIFNKKSVLACVTNLAIRESVYFGELSSNGVQPFCISPWIENSVNVETNCAFYSFLFWGQENADAMCAITQIYSKTILLWLKNINYSQKTIDRFHCHATKK